MSTVTDKLCKRISQSTTWTLMVILMSLISCILCIVLSGWQITANDEMKDVCKNYDIVELFTPFKVTGTTSNGHSCEAYCPWPSHNISLRFTSLALFLLFMIGMGFAMKEMKGIWLIRICLFITLILLFTCFVQDFSALMLRNNVFSVSYHSLNVLLFLCTVQDRKLVKMISRLIMEMLNIKYWRYNVMIIQCQLILVHCHHISIWFLLIYFVS